MSVPSDRQPVSPVLSHDTLMLFAELLSQVSVSAKDAEFDAICARISRARKELTAALQAAGHPAAPTAWGGSGAG